MNFTETAHMFSTANVTFWKTAGGHLLRRFTVRQKKQKTLKRLHAENNGDVFLNTFFTGIAYVVAAVKVTTCLVFVFDTDIFNSKQKRKTKKRNFLF